jgi:very-short-patch-repair endonuclease
VTDPQSTWLHLAVILGERDLVAAGDHLVRSPPVSGTTPLATINSLVERARGYHGRGAVRARAAASRIREGAESRPESLLRLLLVDAGLPEPELQVSITDSAGRFLARADMAYPDWRVIVEYDGDQHRTSTEQYEKDVSRIESLTFAGWSVVRVRALGLRDPSTTHRRVAAALRRAGYAPPSGHRHA